MKSVLRLHFSTRDAMRGERCLCFAMILAPFPKEEQVLGHMTRALLNLRVTIRARLPFVQVEFYAADRLEQVA